MTGAERRTAGLVVVAVTAATALVLLLAVWSASTGPGDPLRGDGPTAAGSIPTEPVQQLNPTPGNAARGDAGERGPLLAILLFGLLGLAVALLLVSLVAFAAGIWGERRARRRAERRTPLPTVERVEDPVDAVAAAMLADADAQEQLLAADTPRNGIVACWHRFEVQAAGAGVPRHGWETSSEFTLRLLDLVEADASAVAELATLFREARFSAHDLGEAERGVALDALRRIHHDLRHLLSRGVR